jgi:hypothetical protein
MYQTTKGSLSIVDGSMRNLRDLAGHTRLDPYQNENETKETV